MTQKKPPSSCFIICRTASLFSVTILPLLAFHHLFITPATQKVAGDQSSKIFHETRFSATGHLSLPHQSTCHLPHPSLHQTGPRSIMRYIGHFLRTLSDDTMMMMIPLNEALNTILWRYSIFQAGQPKNHCSIPSRGKRFPILQKMQIRSGAHPPLLLSVDWGFLSQEVKQSGHKLATCHHLLPALKMMEAMPHSPHTSSWVYSDNFTIKLFRICYWMS